MVNGSQQAKSKVRMMFFPGENTTGQVRLMQLHIKLQKEAEITYLEAHKQETRYLLTYFKVWK